MLVRPSVTPQDPRDRMAAYHGRQALPLQQAQSYPLDRERCTNVRFGSKVDTIQDNKSTNESDLTSEREEFPIRPTFKPVKGRKATGYVPISLPATEINSGDQQSFSSSSSLSADDVQDAAKLRALVEQSARRLNDRSAKGSVGVTGKLASVVRGIPARKKTSDEKAGEMAATTSSPPSGATQSSTKVHVHEVTGLACLTESMAPVFAEGISLFQPKTNNIGRDKAHDEVKSKHAFARLVDAARLYNKRSAAVESSKKGRAVELPKAEEALAPGAKAKLLELAKTAKLRAQQRATSGEHSTQSTQKREQDPSWKCAGLESFPALHEDDVVALSSLAAQCVSLPELDRGQARRREQEKGSQDRGVKSRPGEAQFRFVDNENQIVWIGRDGREMHSGEVKKEAKPEEETKGQRCRRHHHHHHHQKHDESLSSTSKGKSQHRLPEKRRGKVLDDGQDAHRLNLALDLARTRLEMEIAEQYGPAGKVPKRTTKMKERKSSAETRDSEEKAWLDEAYEEAIKKEVESKYLHDVYSLNGGTW